MDTSVQVATSTAQLHSSSFGEIIQYTLSNSPITITLQPSLAGAWAMGPNIGAGEESPGTIMTFRPFSGPHSYTRIVPYGLSTSRAPGRALVGYGSEAACSGVRNGMSVSRGDAIFAGFVGKMWRMRTHVIRLTTVSVRMISVIDDSL